MRQLTTKIRIGIVIEALLKKDYDVEASTVTGNLIIGVLGINSSEDGEEDGWLEIPPIGPILTYTKNLEDVVEDINAQFRLHP